MTMLFMHIHTDQLFGMLNSQQTKSTQATVYGSNQSPQDEKNEPKAQYRDRDRHNMS